MQRHTQKQLQSTPLPFLPALIVSARATAPVRASASGLCATRGGSQHPKSCGRLPRSDTWSTHCTPLKNYSAATAHCGTALQDPRFRQNCVAASATGSSTGSAGLTSTAQPIYTKFRGIVPTHLHQAAQCSLPASASLGMQCASRNHPLAAQNHFYPASPNPTDNSCQHH